ncbi:hypothetical protein H0H93_000435 [Arthromyces matolae]|nr:hypothetical protein H0H93_000435 [Arthromyces matolae]
MICWAALCDMLLVVASITSKIHSMAKSIRSKTKRSYRNKKREDSVYAANEAARLHRLNAKLAVTVSKDVEGDVVIGQEDEGDDTVNPGWFWFTTFGLLDSDDVTVENMDAFTRGRPAQPLFPTHVGGYGLKRQQGTPVETSDMAIDEPTKRVSTHGPRGSRREEWRISKGLEPKPKRQAMNRQGGVAARRKAGRSKRRR